RRAWRWRRHPPRLVWATAPGAAGLVDAIPRSVALPTSSRRAWPRGRHPAEPGLADAIPPCLALPSGNGLRPSHTYHPAIPLPFPPPHPPVMHSADVDALILRVAAPQHGVVARWQLVSAGLHPTLLDERIKGRRLERLARGVYGVPGLSGRHRDALARIFACGPCTVGSHETAGHVQELLMQPPAQTAVSA